MRTRVKICGITNPEDGAQAAAAGADAIGLMFYPNSPRYVTIPHAQTIIRSLPPWVAAIAVVLDPPPTEVDRICEQLPIAGIQFHGQEEPELCARCRIPWIKTVPMREPSLLTEYRTRYAQAAAFLLDGHAPGEPGGRGQTFDWSTVQQGEDPRPLILAGGLTPDNVATAITATRPWAVDVSSGVESAPGRKDFDRVNAFLREVRRADA